MQNHKFTTQGFSDDKYFTFNGKIEKQCPKCQKAVERDFTSEHIEYPEIGEEKALYLWCSGCDTAFSVPFIVKSLSYTVEVGVGDKITIEDE
jgi:hypothetical protein